MLNKFVAAIVLGAGLIFGVVLGIALLKLIGADIPF